MASTTMTMIKKSIALNNAGTFCMERNNTIASIKMFTAAYKIRKELKKKLQIAKRKNSIRRRRKERRRKRSSLTASRSLESSTSMIEINDAVLMTDQQQLLQNGVRSVSASSFFPSSKPTYNQRMTTRIIDVDDFFIPFLPEQHDTGSWIVFRDLIRLPPIEELPVSLSFAWEEEEDDEVADADADKDKEHGKNDNNKKSREKENIILSDEEGQEREEESSSFIDFLSPTYAFNLALAHHHHGCYLPFLGTSEDIHEHQEEEEEVTALSRNSLRQYHFECAGRLYEITMELERNRSNNELNSLRERERGNHNSSSSSNWFTPRITLACMNNLAHMHYLLNNPIQSQRCYRQLRFTVATIYLRSQQANETNTSRDNTEREKDYLQFFWTSAHRGLLQHHYLVSSIPPPTSSTTTTSVTASPLSPTDDQVIAMVATNTDRRTNDISNSKSNRNSTVASSSDERAAAA